AELTPCKLPEEQIERERQRLDRFLLNDRADRVPPAHVKAKLQQTMWQRVGVEKDEVNMWAALDEIARIRGLISNMGVSTRTRRANDEWLDAIDAVNMADACELIIHSSLRRCESRGPFIRRDYPIVDNKNWLAANVLIKTELGMKFEKRPYELPFFKPDFI